MFSFNLNKISFKELHDLAIRTSKNLRSEEAKLIEILGLIDKNKTYLKFTCLDVYDYSEAYLGLTRRKTYDLLQIYKTKEKVPLLNNELENISYTKIRTIIPVINKVIEEDNDKNRINEVINLAKTKTVRELERTVKNIIPDKVETITHPKYVNKDMIKREAYLKEEDELLVQKAIDLICEEEGRNVNFNEFLKIAAERIIENKLKKGNKRAQIIIKEKEDGSFTSKLDTFTSESYPFAKLITENEISKNPREKFENMKTKNYIPAKVKGIVVRRDENKCKVCGKHKNLAYHHIIPRSEGGKHTTENIILLCRSCHNLIHLNYLKLKNENSELKITYTDPEINTFTDYLYKIKREDYIKSKQLIFSLQNPNANEKQINLFL